ncbi:hypothetical protein [Lysinibacillus pakistanensis]|uniref:Core-binding (CB) domain-containing protein n=1 Tax=Lysinibacillus pakistanensis TaxID=759811 RepID=A0ABX6DER9_9BACI|nr:hypothetical protein GDS87_20520 [Lysinibacillus pakistanensis]
MEFKDYLMQEYNISESSAKDYVGRFNGIINRGLYNGEDKMTNTLKEAIEKEFPNSKNHYFLTLERYIKYKKRIN